MPTTMISGIKAAKKIQMKNKKTLPVGVAGFKLVFWRTFELIYYSPNNFSSGNLAEELKDIL